MTFDKFFEECDKAFVRLVGLSIKDMPDASWYEYYELDYKPIEALYDALEDHWAMDMSEAQYDYFHGVFAEHMSYEKIEG